MKILAIDMGTGTQDILIFDSTAPIENSIKMVMPSATQIAAARILLDCYDTKRATGQRRRQHAIAGADLEDDSTGRPRDMAHDERDGAFAQEVLREFRTAKVLFVSAAHLFLQPLEARSRECGAIREQR